MKIDFLSWLAHKDKIISKTAELPLSRPEGFYDELPGNGSYYDFFAPTDVREGFEGENREVELSPLSKGHTYDTFWPEIDHPEGSFEGQNPQGFNTDFDALEVNADFGNSVQDLTDDICQPNDLESSPEDVDAILGGGRPHQEQSLGTKPKSVRLSCKDII